uniref:Nephronophthisis 1 n=1 Tax=Xiphophorus couchianus TaxID=32473 RepID=A0A3B5M385_9TELE
MPPKRRGPLQLAQREVDEIKRQFHNAMYYDTLSANTSIILWCICQTNFVVQVVTNLTLLISVNFVFQADELAPVGNYDQRKLEEERRLQNILGRLVTLSLELSPPGPSTQAGDDNFEEDSDGKDEGDGSTPEKSPSQSAPQIYKVLSDFKAEQEGDLSVRKGEVLKIIKKTADGWWLAQDKIGNRGVVPKTYLKHDKDSDENLDEEEDEDDDEDDEIQQSEQEEEEDEDVDEDEIDTTDVLSAMGAIPSGFRPSTLSKLLAEEGERYRGSHYIQPELSQSQLSFKDLFLDPDTGRYLPIQVLSRHIRMCAFDGTQVLSNIHTVRASYTSKDPKTWNFSPRMTSILPTILDGDCFLRCNSLSPNIGVLFELGVTFLRNSTGERGDLSCGWAFLKLTDDSGNPLQNRTYELPINGGTPYEKKVVLEAPVSRRSPGGVFQQMLQARRQPKLIVKLKSASSRTRLQLSLLPDTLLHCLSCVHLLVLHRQLLADTLLMDRPTMQNADEGKHRRIPRRSTYTHTHKHTPTMHSVCPNAAQTKPKKHRSNRLSGDGCVGGGEEKQREVQKEEGRREKRPLKSRKLTVCASHSGGNPPPHTHTRTQKHTRSDLDYGFHHLW